MSRLKFVYSKVRYLLLPVGVFMFLGIWAQEKAKEKPKPIPVYLGKSDIRDTTVPENIFDSLLQQGLTSRDSLGKEYTVSSFLLTYGERNLYEDSVGSLIVLTDLLTHPCDSGKLAPFLLENITERSKPGDTVYFDQVLVRAPEGYSANGKSMRLVLTK